MRNRLSFIHNVSFNMNYLGFIIILDDFSASHTLSFFQYTHVIPADVEVFFL